MQSTTTEPTAVEPLALSWSGGKEGSIALDRLGRHPRYGVVAPRDGRACAERAGG